MAEVLAIGEPLVVLLPTRPCRIDQAEALTIGVGGAEANTVLLLAQLGHTSLYVSRVGDDPFGAKIVGRLAAAGVDTSAVLIDRHRPTGLYFREWLPDGARRVYYYRRGSAASGLAPDDLEPSAFEGLRLLLISGITAALSNGCLATINRAIDLAHKNQVTVAFDPNYRAALWDPSTASHVLLPLVAKADVVLMGEEDSLAMLGLEGDRALHAVQDIGPRLVVLKAGARGALALSGGHVENVPGREIAQPIDPVGAGDAFNAGFISGWLHGLTVRECLLAGNLLGAAAVEMPGDQVVPSHTLEQCRLFWARP